MKTTTMVWALLCACFLSPLKSMAQVETVEQPIMRTTPYLQNPINSGMTILWQTNVPVYSWVEYGEDANNLSSKAQTLVDGQAMSNNTNHKIRLKGLKPNTTYYYRACSKEIKLYQAYKKEFGETEYSPVYSFTTAPEQGGDFTAIVFNDLHQQKGMLDRLMKQIEGVNYDMVFFNGDCIDDPKDEASALKFLTIMNKAVKAESHPTFFMRGNHEIRNAYSIKLRDIVDYVGDNTTYGAFNWGDTRFVLLDCGEDKADDHWVYYGLNSFEEFRQDQTEFLKKEMKSKEFKKAKKRVLIHHIPVYGNDDKYQPCTEMWHPLLVKMPFNIAINGHTHMYEYLEPGKQGNKFPVYVGGGYKEGTGTIIVLKKQGKELSAEIISDKGEILKSVLL